MTAMIYDRYGDKDVLQTEAFDLSSIKLRRFRRSKMSDTDVWS